MGRLTALLPYFRAYGAPKQGTLARRGTNRYPLSAKMAVQPGGVSRFTIALNGAFCFRTYPLLRISRSGVSILERPLSGGLKSGRQRSQRSFTRWLINGCISAGGVHIFVETPAVLPGCWAPCWRSQQYVVGLHFAGGGNFVKVRKIERRLVF